MRREPVGAELGGWGRSHREENYESPSKGKRSLATPASYCGQPMRSLALDGRMASLETRLTAIDARCEYLALTLKATQDDTEQLNSMVS